jgi:hypothetical protein
MSLVIMSRYELDGYDSGLRIVDGYLIRGKRLNNQVPQETLQL